jgi:hypothetical protein
MESFIDFQCKMFFHIFPQSQLKDTFVIKKHVGQTNDKAVSIAKQT